MNFSKLYGSKNTSNLHAIRRVVENVLEDEQRARSLLETKGEEAQVWLDALQVLAEFPEVTSKLRSSILKMMLRLSKHSGLCPQCLMVKNVKRLGDFPVGGGGFGDVWKGKIGGQIVCLKVVKVYLVSDVQQLLKEYMSEAIVWQQLKHPNLLPFMGMYYLDKAREQLCLVSPWMERGNLVRFLKDTPSEQIDHYSLVHDIASGLVYLHSRKIVHGDLKGVNILLTPDERACIGDFGLSRVADTHALRLTSSTTAHSKGTMRWLSPELLKSDPPCSSSTSSDMYAFACVCYEIFAGNVPFYELTDGAVIVAVLLDKKHPQRPRASLLNDEMWNIMGSCWKPEPQLRPSASEVFPRLSGMKSLKTGRVIQPAPEWDTLNLEQLWKNVKHSPLDLGALVQLQKKLGPPAVVRSAATTSVLESRPVGQMVTPPLDSTPDSRVMQLKADFDAAQRIAEGLDEARRQAELAFMYEDVKFRVVDWRGTPLKAHGRLLQYDTLIYSIEHFSHEYRVLLFERSILFCSDSTPSRFYFAANGNIMPEVGQKQRPITIQVWTRMVDITKAETAVVVTAVSVKYLLNIWWKTDTCSGEYSLRFRTERQMQEWHATVGGLVSVPDLEAL
ncbi:kinase-like protein [Marasmius fiardii PR-910]|nr:kinase-like protein [Marasmius fiardii PR-910]